MKKSLVALSVLSGVFLASNAVASTSWVGSPAQAKASFSVNKSSTVTLGSNSSNSFDGYFNAGEQLFTLTVNAPQGMRVAIAGVNDIMGGDGNILDDADSRPAGAEGIAAIPADKSLLRAGNDYIPTGGKPSTGVGGALVLDGTGNDVDIEFISKFDVLTPVAGKYTYTFIAQAFAE